MTDDRDRWNRRYLEAGAAEPCGPSIPAPPAALVRADAHLPATGFGLDLAGGDGGGACHLAARGLRTILVDVSDVALERARATATSAGLTIETKRIDLSAGPVAPTLSELIPAGPGVVCCFHYLQRDLLAAMPTVLRPGVVFVAAIATVTNLERHERPSARFLLEPGELLDILSTATTTVLHHHEGWTDEGRHEAEIIVGAAS